MNTTLEAQALAVKTSRETALVSRMNHDMAESTLKRHKGLRAIAIKGADPKATVQVIEATLGQEFEAQDTSLSILYRMYKENEIEAEYQNDLLSILKLTYKPV